CAARYTVRSRLVIAGLSFLHCRYALCSLCCLFPLFFSFSCAVRHRGLASFPTRRSSDLVRRRRGGGPAARRGRLEKRGGRSRPRSEEHTSELQSRVDLVCRLLLEKKKRSRRTERRERCRKAWRMSRCWRGSV